MYTHDKQIDISMDWQVWLPVSLQTQERGLYRWKWFRASYKSAAREYSRHTAGVELLQQQQINGHGSEQAVNGNCCMHMHKGGALRAFAASKYHYFEKWAW